MTLLRDYLGIPLAQKTFKALAPHKSKKFSIFLRSEPDPGFTAVQDSGDTAL